MKHIRDIAAGGIITALLIVMAVPVLADLTAKDIQVYNGIRIVLDGVDFVPTDVSGNPVETFVYNGTTYVPIRAVSQAFSKEVSYDPETQTAYISNPASYFLDVCHPYDTSSGYREYHGDETFSMYWVDFSNGFVFSGTSDYAVFTLNGKFESMSLSVGCLDGTSSADCTVVFEVDGVKAAECYVAGGEPPAQITVPLNHGTTLKITREGGGANNDTGFGEITCR